MLGTPQVTSTTHWAYFDYYYLRHLAQGRLDLDWGALGFPERGTADSTLWIGSAGANTPCHIDTYGINLVAQVVIVATVVAVGKDRHTHTP